MISEDIPQNFMNDIRVISSMISYMISKCHLLGDTIHGSECGRDQQGFSYIFKLKQYNSL